MSDSDVNTKAKEDGIGLVPTVHRVCSMAHKTNRLGESLFREPYALVLKLRISQVTIGQRPQFTVAKGIALGIVSVSNRWAEGPIHSRGSVSADDGFQPKSLVIQYSCGVAAGYGESGLRPKIQKRNFKTGTSDDVVTRLVAYEDRWKLAFRVSAELLDNSRCD